MSAKASGRRRPRTRRRPGLTAGVAATALALTPTPAWAAAHAISAATAPAVTAGQAAPSAMAVAVRAALLAATAVVAGVALARLLVMTGPRVAVGARARALVWAAAGVAAGADLLTLPLGHVLPYAVVAQAGLTVATATVLDVAPWLAASTGGLLAALVVVESAAGEVGARLVLDGVCALAATLWLGAATLAATARTATRTCCATPGARARASWLTVGAAVLVAGVGLARLWLDGLGPAPLGGRGWATLLAATPAALLALAGLAKLTARQRGRHGGAGAGPRWSAPTQAACALAAFAAATVAAALPAPATPPPAGVPLATTARLAGRDVPVLLSPARPGPNLVHVGGPTTGMSAGANPTRLTPLTARPGASGGWAVVDLPPGATSLTLRAGDAVVATPVRLGDASSAGARLGAAATGDDGPECASAALGALAAGVHAPLTACPADRLEPADQRDLRALTGFLADRGVPSVTLVADNSPRGVAAAAQVRQAAAARGLPVSGQPDGRGATLVVAGWSGAATALAEHARAQAAGQSSGRPADAGVYLAPWLLTAPVAGTPSGVSLPLRFDPRDVEGLRYAITLAALFPGEPPSAAGFERWAAARAVSLAGPARLYAAAQVQIMPMSEAPGSAGVGSDPAAMAGMGGMAGMAGMGGTPPGRQPSSESARGGMAGMDGDVPGQWLPNGSVVAVTGPIEHG